MAQYVKVIQKNKGAFKNFLKKIEQIQDYKATCGIHKNIGRIKVRHGRATKANYKKLKVKAESKGVVEGKKKSRSSRNSLINLATLSSILEKHITFTAPGGEFKVRRPKRIHIHLEEESSVWAQVKDGIQFETMRYMLELQRSRGKRSGQNLFKEIAEKVSDRQRQRISNKETAGNAQMTIDIKGFDWPLFDSGLLLRSIEGRVVRNSTGKKVRCAYIATNMDEMIRKINSSARG